MRTFITDKFNNYRYPVRVNTWLGVLLSGEADEK